LFLNRNVFFQFYVPVTILLPFFKSRVSERYHLMTEYALRFALVLFTCKFECLVLNIVDMQIHFNLYLSHRLVIFSSWVYTSGFRMRLPHCIAIFYNLPWFCSIKVSIKKLQSNAENACGNRVCKCAFNHSYLRILMIF